MPTWLILFQVVSEMLRLRSLAFSLYARTVDGDQLQVFP